MVYITHHYEVSIYGVRVLHTTVPVPIKHYYNTLPTISVTGLPEKTDLKTSEGSLELASGMCVSVCFVCCSTVSMCRDSHPPFW